MNKNTIIEFIKQIIISIIIAWAILTFIAFPINVKGDSMYPNLKDGDFGFSGVITRMFGYDRFDIVIIEPENGSDKIVKRIIGLPNEKVEYRDNKLYINDEYVAEDFISGTYTEDFSVTLKDDEYFCLGDNREVSKDSRFYGPFSKDEIIAKDIFILLPIDEMGVK